MKQIRFTSILCALLVSVALSAFAGDAPKLRIESPQENAAIPAGPNGNAAVLIKFKTDHFKMISLKDSPALNPSPSLTANGPGAGNPADTGAPSSNSGMARSTAPTAPTGPGSPSSGTQAAGMPQSDAAAPSAPVATGNPNQGFIDVDVDGSPWHFLHSGNDPILLAGLAPGNHRISLQLLGSDLKPVGAAQTLNFSVSSGVGK